MNVSLLDSFEHPIADRATLRFLGSVAAESPAAQRDVYARVAKATDDKNLEAIRDAVLASCSGDEVSHRMIRALALVLSRWKAVTQGDRRFSAFETALLAAVAALAVPGQLSREQIDAALAPFATDMSALSRPVAPSPVACPPDGEARVTSAIEPDFPQFAMDQRVGGVVSVSVTLDDEGLVEAVDVVKAPFVDLRAASALKNATVVSAASSTYAPAIKNCKAIGGTYLFRAEYQMRG